MSQKIFLSKLTLFISLPNISKTELYTSTQIGQLINKYIETQSLVNQNDRAYVNLDDLLRGCIFAKGTTNARKEGADAEKHMQFMRRDDVVKSVLEKMQSWYEIHVMDKEVVTK